MPCGHDQLRITRRPNDAERARNAILRDDPQLGHAGVVTHILRHQPQLGGRRIVARGNERPLPLATQLRDDGGLDRKSVV